MNQNQEIVWPEQAFTQIEQNVQTPYLPPRRSDRKYSLVLDLDETLIHYNEEIQRQQMQKNAMDFKAIHGRNPSNQELSQSATLIFQTRPYSSQFLQELSKLYEIIIFTAAD